MIQPIEITGIKGNSGKDGNSVFSRPALINNTLHMAFNKGAESVFVENFWNG